MYHGMRVIRTDASSGGAPSSSAPPPLSYGPDTGLLDRGYAGSCSAMLKVAQMVRIRGDKGSHGSVGGGELECFAKVREQLRFLSVQVLLGFVWLSGVSQERQQDFASPSQQQLALLAAFLRAGNALHVLPTPVPARI